MTGDVVDSWREAKTLQGPERGRDRSPGSAGVALTIAYHPNPARVGERARLGSQGTHGVSRVAPPFSGCPGGARLPLADPYLSRKPIVLTWDGDGISLSTAGTSNRLTVDGETVEEARLDAARIARGVVLELSDRVVLVLHACEEEGEKAGFGLLGDSDAICRVRRRIRQVADTTKTVLVRGESGAGKELVARAIHDASPRRARRFVAVNFAGITAALAASALFGHERGAFTGADRAHAGHFREADRGTLFLDEIGDAPREVQVQLLRALESGDVSPLGARRPVPVDVRVVAATDAELEREAESGRFRAPLLHRLAGFEITVPPLRDRREDIAVLLLEFLRRELDELGEGGRLTAAAGPWLAPGVVARLVRYDWPGNVRQLKNIAGQLAVAARGAALQDLDPGDLPISASARLAPAPGPIPPPKAVAPSAPKRTPSEISHQEVHEALRANRWQVRPAAKSLGVSSNTLYGIIERSPVLRTANEVPEAELRRCFDDSGGDLDAMVATLQVSRRAIGLRLKTLGLL